MKLLTICRLSVSCKIQNVRLKCTKAAVLKTINEPLVFEDFKISDKLEEGQVNITKTSFLIATAFSNEMLVSSAQSRR